MAKRKPRRGGEPDAIDELETWGERAGEWLSENAKTVLAVAAVCLVIAAVFGYQRSERTSAELEAADALSEIREQYLRDMGASPGDLIAPELANPAAGEEIRARYVDRYREVAEQHPETDGAALARLEQGNLIAEGGDLEAALAIWRAGLADLPGGRPVAGLLHQRIAQALEVQEDWAGAAAAYETAAATPDFTFRLLAAVDAARCYLQAEQPDRAAEIYARVEAEAPGLPMPDYLRIRLRELTASTAEGS